VPAEDQPSYPLVHQAWAVIRLLKSVQNFLNLCQLTFQNVKESDITFMVYHTIPERALTDPSATPEKFEAASPKKSCVHGSTPIN
jgi:hypothetical protein